jgi:hypothetical protein
MKTLRMKHFCVTTDTLFCRIWNKHLILRHSNGEFYDYYVYYPYLKEKVQVISVLQTSENPDLDVDNRFFEINDGFLLHIKYFESYTFYDHKVKTRVDELTEILPKLTIGRGRVRRFRKSVGWHPNSVLANM